MSRTHTARRRGPALAIGLALSLAACSEKPPETPAPKVTPVPLASEAAPPPPAATVPAPAKRDNPDAMLAARVKRALENDAVVRDQGIDVTVKAGVVQLWGTVASASESERAAQVAAAEPGVSSVENRLVVVRGS